MALVAGTTGTAFLVGQAGAATSAVDYKVQSQWDTGFTAAVTITNNAAAKSSWSVKWSYAGNQKVTNGWNGKISQNGADVTVANEGYNNNLASGGSVSFGFNGTYSGTNSVPATFTLDGVTCNVDTGGDTGGGTGGGTGGATRAAVPAVVTGAATQAAGRATPTPAPRCT